VSRLPPRPSSPWPRVLLTVLGLGLLALVVHTIFGEHGYLALRQQEKELERLELQIKRLEEENRRLAAEVEALKSDPQAIERVAREELKLARPGEKVITLPPEGQGASGAGEKKK